MGQNMLSACLDHLMSGPKRRPYDAAVARWHTFAVVASVVLVVAIEGLGCYLLLSWATGACLMAGLFLLGGLFLPILLVALFVVPPKVERFARDNYEREYQAQRKADDALRDTNAARRP